MALPVTLLAQDPPYRQFTTRDGLPSQVVYCATQDHEGFMWFGTDAGACRYDGSTFTTFNTSDGLGDNEVLRIFCDREGRVWFMALNSKLSFYQNGSIHNARTDPYLARIKGRSGANNCVQDSSGDLYFASLTGQVFRLSGQQVTMYELAPLADGPPGSSLLASSPDEGVLVLFHPNILRIDAHGAKILRSWDSDTMALVTTRQDGQPIAWGAGHLRNMITGSLIESDIKDNPDEANIWPDRSNGLWVTNRYNGVQHVPNANIPAVHMLDRFTVTMVFEDDAGGTWFCSTGQGLLYASREQLSIRVYRPSINGIYGNPTCLSTFEDEIWFGTDQGEIHRLSHGTLQRVVAQPKVRRDRVRAIVKDRSSVIHYATDKGTWRLRRMNGRWSRTHVSYFEPRNRDPFNASLSVGMKTLAVDRDGHVLASMFAIGEVKDTLGTSVIIIRPRWAPEFRRIYALLPDSSGRLWYETDQRLHCVENDTVTDFPELDTLFGARITSIAALDRRTLVVGSAGGGVSLLRDGRCVKRFREANDLCGDQCRRVVVHNGAILVATEIGAYMIADPLGEPRTQRWTINDGLPVNDVQDIAVASDQLILATAEGLCVVPIRAPEPHRAPRLVIRSLRLDNVPYPPTATVRFVRGISSLLVDLQALVFAPGKDILYAYRTGADADWIETSAPSIQFTELPKGEQRIEVRARGNGSDWGPSAWLTVEVSDPWYAHWSAKLGVALALFFLALLLSQAATRAQMRKQRTALEREQAVVRERQRIAADMHDDLGAEISSLMMSARAASSQGGSAVQDLPATVENRTKGIMDKMDEILWSLDPKSDTLLSTLSFIQRYAEEFAAANALHFQADVRGPLDGHHVNATVRRDLYLAIKEALRNVAQHANATELRLAAQEENGVLTVVLRDNGKGFSTEEQRPTGHGLNNIRDRTLRMGGEVHMEHPSGGGTAIRIRIPLKRE